MSYVKSRARKVADLISKETVKIKDDGSSILKISNRSTETSNWTFETVSNKLIFKYGGVAKAELDTSGNLKAVGDSTAYGTIS